MPVVDMTVGDFMQPVVNRVRTQFLTPGKRLTT